ncbi:peptidyl-alpha-hydroxyglycine alpha-amidating lyase 2-like [Dreissena polymorpha]|uniref:peptidylamidoglycolate lyase n=1 Tax=Dreissena polymorpha TaxID=45954 RepID=A0A9D4KLK6_DREPO|nr:peptidyl-alpha-hydroxyglycine alpha-amidating lyase 2-like [Dreissena polymorpha]KAH3841699.1 hypothetical protein DPMN_115172 [Dreissena polymorpha]
MLISCLCVLGVVAFTNAKAIKDSLDDIPYDLLLKLKELAAQYDYPDYYTGPEPDDASGALREVPNWPTERTRPLIGQVGGLAVDSEGQVVVFHRAERRWDASSFVFNRLNPALGPIKGDVFLKLLPESGEVLSQFGGGQFYMPHGLTLDADDNMWITDVGLHQVMKIPKGSTTPSLVLGVKMEPGSDDTHFCKPTDVAVASTGEFFVADGYCNSRILKYSSSGTLLTKWGRPMSGTRAPEVDQLYIPHSLALVENKDLICVADRENSRIQCFDAGLNGTTAGTFRKSLQPNRGTIYAIEYDPNSDVIYVVNGPGMNDIIEGFTLDLDGNILETWGPRGTPMEHPHDVTVSRDGINVYAGDIGQDPRVYKFERPYGMAKTAGTPPYAIIG